MSFIKHVISIISTCNKIQLNQPHLELVTKLSVIRIFVTMLTFLLHKYGIYTHSPTSRIHSSSTPLLCASLRTL